MDRNHERDDIYKRIDEIFQNLYGSPESGALMFRVFQQFQLSEDIYSQYAEIIGDTILGFYKIADMPRLFQQKLEVSADVSQRMTSQLIEFLAPVVKREEEASKLQAESTATLIQTFAESQPEAEIERAAPQSHTQVTPLRTMEGDITRIHGYGADNATQEVENETPTTSSQDQLLSKE
jgi:hypothetical protein